MKTHSLIVALAVATVLAACGGGAGNGQADMKPPATDPGIPVPPVLDAFFAAVQALVGDSSDTAEPAAVDTVAVTMPEDGEPRPLK
ncbi:MULTISPECIES: hypothetical protein [Rugamonas]|uniref:Lipoprotein n=1 Tax=Rugamonas rubra TaxID=758825 RepID=A0A1I4I817_9BURK|nr:MULTISPECIES: hypothetical protein [Rugamonas]WGG51446.1 hypothetical protein QC826_04060 [Rugamonas sp. DEMB1]SFL49856.1 hypothetical protein SAMN02982985_00503 [Rugamonas rubra]